MLSVIEESQGGGNLMIDRNVRAKLAELFASLASSHDNFYRHLISVKAVDLLFKMECIYAFLKMVKLPKY